MIIFNEGQDGSSGAVDRHAGQPEDHPGSRHQLRRRRTALQRHDESRSRDGTRVHQDRDRSQPKDRQRHSRLAKRQDQGPDHCGRRAPRLGDPGPGINDNGSGTSTILEIAEQLKALGYTKKLQRQVRFAFWGAEEPGLLGSQYYVDHLTEAQKAKIYANLNFDMVGSPNYVRFVYDGDGSASEPAGPPGSDAIEDIFTSYFDSQNLASEPTAFDGRSDYGPFIAEGIPAGGLFSGAEGIKTAEEAAIYGGTAGEPYDACYHQACDTINNLNTKALVRVGRRGG